MSTTSKCVVTSLFLLFALAASSSPAREWTAMRRPSPPNQTPPASPQPIAPIVIKQPISEGDFIFASFLSDDKIITVTMHHPRNSRYDNLVETIHIWDAKSGKRSATNPRGYSNWSNNLSEQHVSPDGSKKLTIENDGTTVRVWTLAQDQIQPVQPATVRWSGWQPVNRLPARTQTRIRDAIASIIDGHVDARATRAIQNTVANYIRTRPDKVQYRTNNSGVYHVKCNSDGYGCEFLLYPNGRVEWQF